METQSPVLGDRYRYAKELIVKLDLRKDYLSIYKYLARRISEHRTHHLGPGKDDAPVRRIQFGFEYEQSGWVTVIFDTRPKASNDGEWTRYIDNTLLRRPRWNQAFNSMDTSAAKYIRPDGTEKNVYPSSAKKIYRHVSFLHGELLKSIILTSANSGMFDSLPLARKCNIGIEDFAGHGEYSWPDESNRVVDLQRPTTIRDAFSSLQRSFVFDGTLPAVAGLKLKHVAEKKTPKPDRRQRAVKRRSANSRQMPE